MDGRLAMDDRRIRAGLALAGSRHRWAWDSRIKGRLALLDYGLFHRKYRTK
jgi:hypothetical protein